MGETCSVCSACTDQQEIRTANSHFGVSRVITNGKSTNKKQKLSNNINNINILNQPKISIQNIHYNSNITNNSIPNNNIKSIKNNNDMANSNNINLIQNNIKNKNPINNKRNLNKSNKMI